MVNILYEFNGQKIEPENVRDSLMLGTSTKISKALNRLPCPICKDSSCITAVISGGTNFGVRFEKPCHPEFEQLQIVREIASDPLL